MVSQAFDFAALSFTGTEITREPWPSGASWRMSADLSKSSGWKICQILEAAFLHSGISDDDLSEIGNVVASTDVPLEIEEFLGDRSELDRVCKAMMVDAVGLNENQDTLSISRTQLYALTQRLIFSFGARAPKTMSNISEVFGATVQEKGVGLSEFSGFLASVLTQLRKERETQESDGHTTAVSQTEDSSWPTSWLEGAAARLLQRVDNIAVKLDDLVEPETAELADELMAPLHFRPAPLQVQRGGARAPRRSSSPVSRAVEVEAAAPLPASLLEESGLPVHAALADSWAPMRLLVRPGSSYLDLAPSKSDQAHGDVRFRLSDICRVVRERSGRLCTLCLEFEEGSLFLRMPSEHAEVAINGLIRDCRIPIVDARPGS